MAHLGASMSEIIHPVSAEYDPRAVASFFASGETITDMGLRLVPHGEIALYVSQSSTAMAIVCQRCFGFAVFLRPWSWDTAAPEDCYPPITTR